ncbi:CDP-alcohol phosphatidyltransferase family protein [Pacificibacter marinus]|uniref:CDP-alcohol phosphatidyltransferase family protein n=1 Tax=Pacificibacter marinus TaxID=658057 RepID=UPI001C0742D2|nr:CDP-alcohol phosphatidyltransferase family protein [Pacificibacter marinus]MBU2865613.1 phosphatidylcholine synthase [Pacificibacter marinus]
MHTRLILANSIHLLTALGAALALLALFSAAQGAWSHMFLWLLAALVVDGIDGPLARKVDTKTHAPRIDGAVLDLVVDFLTYVFVPVFAIVHSGMIPEWAGWTCALTVTTVSALYFADTRMKTEDASFEGFPACWNMVALVFFALEPPVWAMIVTMLLLTPAMFLPIRFVHPTRTTRWRAVTLPATITWIIFSVLLLIGASEPWMNAGLILTSLYLLGAGIAQQIIPAQRTTQ